MLYNFIMKPIKKDTNRIAKVNAFIQTAMGPILHEFLAEEDGLFTVSKVETSRDMKWAKIWISILGGEDNRILKRLNTSIYFLQGELNKNFSTKIIPRISFHLDTTPRHAQHIDELIKKIHENETK